MKQVIWKMKKSDKERDKGNGLKVGCFKSRRSKERHRAWIVVAAEEVFVIMYARCQLQQSDGSSLSCKLTICMSESRTLVIAWLTINIMRQRTLTSTGGLDIVPVLSKTD